MKLFFFSSRRRHTRFDCDWSSDVCSSDLAQRAGSSPAQRGGGDLHLLRHLVEQRLGRRTRKSLLARSEEHTSELQSQSNLVCRLLLEKKKKKKLENTNPNNNNI